MIKRGIRGCTQICKCKDFEFQSQIGLNVNDRYVIYHDEMDIWNRQ